MAAMTQQEQPGDRATAFLAAFNEIERHLRRELGEDRHVGFTWMVNELHERGRLPERQQRALVAFARLRNAIAHGEYREGRPIADPLPETVAEIRRLAGILVDPPTVLGVLERRDPVTVAPDDPVDRIHALLRETTYSQFPVYEDGSCVGLLTTDAVARWVAADLGADGRLGARTVAEVLGHAGHEEIPVLVPRDVTVAEAARLLTRPGADGRLPRALVVTEHGRAGQRPLRVVGGGDLPALYEALSLDAG